MSKVLHTLSIFEIREEVIPRGVTLWLYDIERKCKVAGWNIWGSKRGPGSVWAARLNQLANLAIDKLQQMDASGDVRLV